LVSLAETLIESGGKTNVAAQNGVSRNALYSKLGRLGLSLRQLKARLNVIHHGRAGKSMSKDKARL